MRENHYRLVIAAVVLVVASVTVSSARAGLIVSSETVISVPGSSGFVQILLENDFSTPQSLSGFSFEIVLGGTGARFGGIDNQTVPEYVFGDFGTGLLSFDLFPNSSFIASDMSLNADGFVTLAPGERYGLARVFFEVDNVAAAGLRPITFIAGPTTLLLDGNNEVFPGADWSLVNGGIDVQAPGVVPVPEPASIMVWLTGCVGLTYVQLRRKRLRPLWV